jgi:uncharacterized protein YndB with AHSA1/START domain
MDEKQVARAFATMNAPASKVWDALVNPDVIKQYMFGATVRTDWKEGSPISWKGEWKGKPYEDKGVIQKVEPKRRLTYSHYSPMTGLPDAPENYHTVDVQLKEEGGRTQVTLTQDNNKTEEERRHSEKNWSGMLEGMKTVVEK